MDDLVLLNDYKSNKAREGKNRKELMHNQRYQGGMDGDLGNINMQIPTF